MQVDVGIEELLAMETELKTQSESATSSLSLEAKVNILKYLQVQTVIKYENAYDALHYELDKNGGLSCLRNIASVRLKDHVQPKVLELQDCSEDDRLEKELEFYLEDATFAKQCLDELVAEVTKDVEHCEIQFVDVKALESTRRKASKFCGGDVRKVTDMARVSVICDTPEALEQAYLAIMGFLQAGNALRVKNGFLSDWMPGGYRDVKVNPVVNEHLCEIQLQLRDFFTLKSGQHAVYTWARELTVSKEMDAEHLFEELSPEVLEEMMILSQLNGMRHCLADLYLATGQYDLAESGLREELLEAEDEKRGVEDDRSKESREAEIRVSNAGARLSVVLAKMGKYDDAGLLLERSLAFNMTELGPEHPSVAAVLDNRAGLLQSQGMYAEAEPLYKRCHEIYEKVLGPEHPYLATTLNNRAALFRKQDKYAEAGPFYDRSLAISEKALGPDNPESASVLSNLPGLLSVCPSAFGSSQALTMLLSGFHFTFQGKYAEVDPLSLLAIEIGEETLGPDHTDLATALNNRGKYPEAGPLYARAAEIVEKTFGPEHPSVATALNNRALLLETQGKFSEAEPLYRRTQEIFEKSLGGDHPDVATILNNRAGLFESQGKFEEAEPLYKRSLAIDEKVYGSNHPEVATDLNNLALVLEDQCNYAEAVPLRERAMEIWMKALGPDHPTVATALQGRAVLFYKQEEYMEAIPLLERALSIRMEKLGENHPDTVDSKENLRIVRQQVLIEQFASSLPTR